MINRKKLAYRIVDLVQSSGKTQKALAEEIGVWDTGLSTWLSGKYIPNLESAYKFAHYFGLTVEELLEGCIE